MKVTATLKCEKCKHTDEYSSDDIVFDHLVCKKCGKEIKVLKFVNATNFDYVSIKGTVHRRDPKVHMTKKQRRRLRDENLLDRYGNDRFKL